MQQMHSDRVLIVFASVRVFIAVESVTLMSAAFVPETPMPRDLHAAFNSSAFHEVKSVVASNGGIVVVVVVVVEDEVVAFFGGAFFIDVDVFFAAMTGNNTQLERKTKNDVQKLKEININRSKLT